MRLLIILLTLILTACGGGSAVAPVGNYGSQARSSYLVSKPPALYKVRRGDTLYSISWRYNMDYKVLARINGIRSPYTIFTGQKLRFKGRHTAHRAATRSSYYSASRATQSRTSAKKATSNKSKVKTRNGSTTYNANRNLVWRWPTRGRLLSTYSASSPSKKGIDIAGKAGQSVVAAASGKVVYSGNGLLRYGNLLIIKHNGVYLSAYAHNKSLLVKEGAFVKAGQKIATLGRTGTESDKLHFEIRRNGKPVDPLRFLPKHQ